MKFWNYVLLSVGLSLLFEMAGIPVASNLLTYIGININPVSGGFSLQSAGIYLAIFGAAGIFLAVTVGLFVGIITRSQPENYIILPFITAGIVWFIVPFVGIVTEVFKGTYPIWVRMIVLFICALLGVGMVIASYEHFRGTD